MSYELFGLFVTEFQCSKCFGYYFANNVGGTTFEQTLITDIKGLFVCNN